jgi:hypothetical protein
LSGQKKKPHHRTPPMTGLQRKDSFINTVTGWRWLCYEKYPTTIIWMSIKKWED